VGSLGSNADVVCVGLITLLSKRLVAHIIRRWAGSSLGKILHVRGFGKRKGLGSCFLFAVVLCTKLSSEFACCDLEPLKFLDEQNYYIHSSSVRAVAVAVAVRRRYSEDF